MDRMHVKTNLPGDATSGGGRRSGNDMSFEAEPNKPLAINRFPEEVLSYILLLAGPPSIRDPYPYLPLLRVCHYWRTLILGNPAFWTFILIRAQDTRDSTSTDLPPLMKESIRRSKTLMLDVVIYCFFLHPSDSLIAFFASECSRIRFLQFAINGTYRDPLELMESNKKSFSSLRHLLLGRLGNTDHLWSVIARSENLRTLQCSSPNVREMDKLVGVFSRLVRLSITTPYSSYSSNDDSSVQHVIASLHNNPVLQELSFEVEHGYQDENYRNGPIILPELQVLWTNCWPLAERICAPKLSHLNVYVPEFATLKSQEDVQHCSLLANADFSSIKWLEVTDRQSAGLRNSATRHCSVVGSKDPAYPQNYLMNFLDFFSQHHSRDQFLFQLKCHGDHEVSMGLWHIFSIVLPRMTNLSILRLRLPDGLYDIEEILKNVPSVEKLIVDDGDNIKNFIQVLDNTSLCSCLKELSYMTYWIPKDLERYAETVGRSLTSTLQMRQENNVHQLKSIIVKNCPPLQDIWLEKLRSLGTEIVTATDLVSVTRRTSI